MLAELAKYVENDLSVFSETELSSFIIGASPSRGARSPVLWNRAFATFNIPCSMFPLDVKEENLDELFEILENNERVIGGCVAAPYKENIFNLVDASRMSDAVSKIGTANNFFKSSVTGSKFWAANTDGAAAASQIASLVETTGQSMFGINEVAVLGTGGTSKAVVPHLLDNLDPSAKVRVHYHSNKPRQDQFVGPNIQILEWSVIDESIATANLIVNCTSVGSGNKEKNVPVNLGELLSKRDSSDLVVYDVNYQPSPTKLVKEARELSLVAADGLGMNLEQAVLAFKNCVEKEFGAFDPLDITRAMQE